MDARANVHANIYMHAHAYEHAQACVYECIIMSTCVGASTCMHTHILYPTISYQSPLFTTVYPYSLPLFSTIIYQLTLFSLIPEFLYHSLQFPPIPQHPPTFPSTTQDSLPFHTVFHTFWKISHYSPSFPPIPHQFQSLLIVSHHLVRFAPFHTIPHYSPPF